MTASPRRQGHGARNGGPNAAAIDCRIDIGRSPRSRAAWNGEGAQEVAAHGGFAGAAERALGACGLAGRVEKDTGRIAFKRRRPTALQTRYHANKNGNIKCLPVERAVCSFLAL